MTKKAVKGFAGAAGLIAILTVFSRLAGLARKLAQSWAMSDGTVASAYDTANTVPNVLFEVAAGGALAGAVIPLIAGYVSRQQHDRLSQTVSALISWILLVGIPVAVIVGLTAYPLVSVLFGPATDPAVISLSATLLQIFAIQIPLYGLSVVFTGVLQAHGKFGLPALAPLLSSIAVILSFSAYAYYFGADIAASEVDYSGVLILGLGTTFGVVIFSLPQILPMRKLLHFRFTLKFPAGVASKSIALAGAGLAALSAQQIAIVVIMYIANSAGGVGAFTTFNYAYTVFMVPYGVLCVPIATAVFPKISASVAAQDSALTLQLVRRSTQLVILFGAAAAAMLVALAKPAKTVLEVGRDIAYLDSLMQAMAGGLIGFSLLYHVARIMYALGHGKKVVLQNTFAWGSVCLTLVIWNVFGLAGRENALFAIGVALTIGMSVGAVMCVRGIYQVLGADAIRGILRLIVSLVAVIAPMTWIAWRVVQWIHVEMFPSVLGAFAAAVFGSIIILSGTGGIWWLFQRISVRQ